MHLTLKHACVKPRFTGPAWAESEEGFISRVKAKTEQQSVLCLLCMEIKACQLQGQRPLRAH